MNGVVLHFDDGDTVVVPPETLRMVGVWCEHLRSVGFDRFGHDGWGADAAALLKQAKLVPSEVTENGVSVLLATTLIYVHQNLRAIVEGFALMVEMGEAA